MGVKKEILRYEADTTDAEAKVKSLGEAESQTMGDAKRATDATSTSVKDLTKDKEKLGAAVRATGGQFSGMIGDLGGVVELMTQGGKAAIGLGAALAGLGLATTVIARIREEFKRLAEEEEKVTERFGELKQSFMEPQARMAETLQRYAALTPGTEAAAGDMRRRLERKGLTREAAIEMAPLAVIEGLPADEAALAAQLQMMGVQFGGAGTVQETIGKQQPEVIEAARRQLDVFRQTELGKTREAVAEPQPIGAVKLTPQERVFETMRALKAIPGEMTKHEFEQQVARVGEVEAELAAAPREGRLPYYREPGWFGRTRIAEQVEAYFQELQGPMVSELLDRERHRETGRLPAPQVPGEPAAGPVQYINVGTVIGPAGNSLLSPHDRGRPGDGLYQRGRE